MPKAKRERRERTNNYHLIEQWYRPPEQRLYEGIRLLVLFGETAKERAEETSLAERALRRVLDAFDRQGLLSLFRPTKEKRANHPHSLPVMMRQLIVDLKAEYPDFTLGRSLRSARSISMVVAPAITVSRPCSLTTSSPPA